MFKYLYLLLLMLYFEIPFNDSFRFHGVHEQTVAYRQETEPINQ